MNVVRNNNNNTNGNNINNNNNSQACAACKYQRKKCAPDCILAPYFPHDRQRQFLNAHKLFGVRNITRIIENLDDPHHRNEAMRSIIFQSDMRATDPVGGCYRHIQELLAQIQYHEAELELVLQQLAVFRAQACRHRHHLHRHEIVDNTTPDHYSSLYSPSIVAPEPSPVSHYQYVQQQQPEPMNMVVVKDEHHDHSNNNDVANNLHHQDDVNYWIAQDSMSLSLQNKNGGDEHNSGCVSDELYNDHKRSLSSSMLDIHRT